jgi:hypothetical protein
MDMRPTILLFAALAMPVSAFADCVARSGERITPLIELYTAEGCSSCPPADRWLSSLRGPADARAVVPIAYHVDYWNDLGWRDVYSDARYTQRQRDMAKVVGAKYVYTPQIVLDGKDLRETPGPRGEERLEAAMKKRAKASIEIGGTTSAPRVTASLAKGVKTEDQALVVAVTQDGIQTRVRAGENRGKTLSHDFVARELSVEREWSKGETASIDAHPKFTPRDDWQPDHMRVVAFVQDVGTGEVLQAVAAVCR